MRSLPFPLILNVVSFGCFGFMLKKKKKKSMMASVRVSIKPWLDNQVPTANLVVP